jgi:hypothetical protein
MRRALSRLRLALSDSDQFRKEFERLQKELESRQSVLHFAQGGVAMVLSLIFAGASAKLFWDSVRSPILGFLTSALALGLALYALRRYWSGRRLLKNELEQFESLKDLRRRLRIDDPSVHLPR